MAVFTPGPGEPKSLGRLNNQKKSWMLVNMNSSISYNSPIDKTEPVSLKDISEFFNNPSSTTAPHFTPGAPFKMSEWSSFKDFQRGDGDDDIGGRE
jgi:hypothetical protein